MILFVHHLNSGAVFAESEDASIDAGFIHQYEPVGADFLRDILRVDLSESLGKASA